jgi:hypothetical protein
MNFWMNTDKFKQILGVLDGKLKIGVRFWNTLRDKISDALSIIPKPYLFILLLSERRFHPLHDELGIRKLPIVPSEAFLDVRMGSFKEVSWTSDFP